MRPRVKQKKTVTGPILLSKSQNEEEADAPLEDLISELGSRNDVIRVKARRSLVAKGKTAVRPLIEALADTDDTIR